MILDVDDKNGKFKIGIFEPIHDTTAESCTKTVLNKHL